MAAGFRSVRFDQREVDKLLRSPTGTVGRHLARTGGFVTRAAQELEQARLERHTLQYARGFSTTTTREGREVRTRISNSAGHATFIENGTRPHIIRPKRPGGVLVFRNRQGQLVFAKQVHHPGTRPYRILRDALRLGMRRAGNTTRF